MLPHQTTESAGKPVERFSQKQNCATLLRRIAAGDEAAFDSLYNATRGLLFGLLLRVLGHSQAAEDVLGNVYTEVRERAVWFDEHREAPLTWLVTIAHRQGLERLYDGETDKQQFEAFRRNNGSGHLPIVSETEINIREQRRLVHSAINALTPAQREILELAFFSGMKESEIAEHLGQSLETVKLSMQEAVKRLNALFNF